MFYTKKAKEEGECAFYYNCKRFQLLTYGTYNFLIATYCCKVVVLADDLSRSLICVDYCMVLYVGTHAIVRDHAKERSIVNCGGEKKRTQTTNERSFVFMLYYICGNWLCDFFLSKSYYSDLNN